MKKLFILIVMSIGFILISCIDSKYDLSQIESDGIAIGNNDSEFLMPLVNIKFQASNFNASTEDDMSISGLQEQINVWLPAQLPNNASYVDIQKLANNKEYKQALLDNLYAEMQRDENKRKEVCKYVIAEHKPTIIEALRNSSNAVVAAAALQINRISDTEAVDLLSNLFITYPTDVKNILNDISDEDLIDNVEIENVLVDIPAFDISDDVLDMLVDNLDGDNVTSPINALYLFGTINSNFPFLFKVNPTIYNTRINFGELSIDNGSTKINDIRVFRDDFEKMSNGSQLVMPVILEKYYPNIDINDNTQLDISISLRKTGGLNL